MERDLDEDGQGKQKPWQWIGEAEQFGFLGLHQHVDKVHEYSPGDGEKLGKKLRDKVMGLDEGMELDQGEGGGTVDDVKEAMRNGGKVLLWGPDPRGEIGKVFDTIVGRAELVSVDVHNRGGWGRKGTENIRDTEGRPGWLTVWRLVEGRR